VSQIQRFRHDISGHPNGTRWAVLTPDDKGSVVYYSDYAHLQRSHEALREALLEINKRRTLGNGMADLFYIVMREENGKQVCIGDLIDAALTEAAAQKENGNG